MSWFKSLFSESSDVSMTRVLSALVIVSAVILSFVSLFIDKPLESLIFGLLGAGFGGKVAQKFGERNGK